MIPPQLPNSLSRVALAAVLALGSAACESPVSDSGNETDADGHDETIGAADVTDSSPLSPTTTTTRAPRSDSGTEPDFASDATSGSDRDSDSDSVPDSDSGSNSDSRSNCIRVAPDLVVIAEDTGYFVSFCASAGACGVGDATEDESRIDATTLASTLVPDGNCTDLADGMYTTAPPAPEGRACTDQSYDDHESCDCGGGIPDPDCDDDVSAKCDECNGPGSCGAAFEGGAVAVPDDNPLCFVPPNWTCEVLAYDDGATCDCGCGAVDLDCESEAVAACGECNGMGSCFADGEDCSAIAPIDNATCDPILIGWTCPLEYYYDDELCSCGCGIPDPDCDGDPSLAACWYCSLPGSCSDYGCGADPPIAPENNAVCL
ncbi:MAG: hypothetical protein ACRBN8_18445 [Nannocystales bacterium]